jgi:hypothetical protein
VGRSGGDGADRAGRLQGSASRQSAAGIHVKRAYPQRSSPGTTVAPRRPRLR